MDGRIGRHLVDEGNLVQAGQMSLAIIEAYTPDRRLLLRQRAGRAADHDDDSRRPAQEPRGRSAEAVHGAALRTRTIRTRGS